MQSLNEPFEHQTQSNSYTIRWQHHVQYSDPTGLNTNTTMNMNIRDEYTWYRGPGPGRADKVCFRKVLRLHKSFSHLSLWMPSKCLNVSMSIFWWTENNNKPDFGTVFLTKNFTFRQGWQTRLFHESLRFMSLHFVSPFHHKHRWS